MLPIPDRVRAWVAALLLCAALPAAARVEIGGVSFDDQIELRETPLHLNGAGLRTKFFFKVYAMGLYLPAAGQSAAQAIAAQGPKRVRIVTLRDLTAEQFADGLVDGIRANHDDATYQQLKPRVEALRSAMLSLGKAPQGSEVILDLDPASGTRLSVGGQQLGAAIEGEDFQAALLRVWLGNQPADAGLKAALAPARQ